MANQLLRAFISSRMKELAHEREAIKAALADAYIETFIFEADEGSRSQSIQETFLEEVEAADVYIGIFAKGYGKYTIEEYEHARVLGMDCLIYEKRIDNHDERDPQLSTFLKKLHDVETGHKCEQFRSAAELTKLVRRDLAKWQAAIVRQSRTPRADTLYQGIPSRPPADFIGRQQEIEDVVRALCAGRDTAIEGLGGIGKTTFAIAVAHHPGIRRRFDDGILWASLGPQPDVASAIIKWGKGLTGLNLLNEDLTKIASLDERIQAVKNAIGARRMLIIIDDAWSREAAQSLQCGGINCSHLLTTRDKTIARSFVRVSERALALSTFDDTESLALLRHIAPAICDSDEQGCRRLIARLGGLPQALRLVGGYLAGAKVNLFGDLFSQQHTPAGEQDVISGVSAMLDPARRLALAEKRLGEQGEEKTTLEEAIALSLDDLPPSVRLAFYGLGAFAPKPEWFTPAAAQAVTCATAGALETLAARNLLEVDLDNRRLTIHPVVVDVARTQLPPEATPRHYDYYVKLVQECAGEWNIIDAEYGQLREAWRQSQDDESLYKLLGSAHHYQSARGFFADAKSWAERALRIATEHQNKPAQAHLKMRLSSALIGLGYLSDAQALMQQSYELWDVMSEPHAIREKIDVGMKIALNTAKLGQPEVGNHQIERALTLAKSLADDEREATCLLVKSFMLREYFAVQDAVAPLQRAVELYRKRELVAGEADAHALLGLVFLDLDRHETALEHINHSLTLRERLGLESSATESQMLIAKVQLSQGSLAAAQEAVDCARMRAEARGDDALLDDSLIVLSSICHRLNQYEETLACYRQRIALAKKRQSRRIEASVLRDIASLHRQHGEHRKALNENERALSIYRELQDQAGMARTFEIHGLIHDELNAHRDALASFEQALSIWQSLDNRAEQGIVWRYIGMIQRNMDKCSEAQHAYQAAIGIFRDTRVTNEPATTLNSLAYLHQRLVTQSLRSGAGFGHASSQQKTIKAKVRGSWREHLDAAIAALTEARQWDREEDRYQDRLKSLTQQRSHALRYGPKILDRMAMETPISVVMGTQWLSPSDPAYAERRVNVEKRITNVNERIHLAFGFGPPMVQLDQSHAVVPVDAYMIELNDIPLVMDRHPTDERLVPCSVKTLYALDIPAIATVHPVTGQSAAWVPCIERARIEAHDLTMWRKFDYFEHRLQSVLQDHMAAFLGHQETMALLVAADSSVADHMRAHSQELSALVGLLRRMLDEHTPITPFKRVLEMYVRQRARGADFLAILQTIRGLPEIRARLRGNDDSYYYFQLDDNIEQSLMDNVVKEKNGQAYLALDPQLTQRILGEIRNTIDYRNTRGHVGLVVTHNYIRRFARKLVELEFPALPVLAKTELLPGLRDNVIGAIEAHQLVS